MKGNKFKYWFGHGDAPIQGRPYGIPWFREGYAIVSDKSGKENHIRPDGTLLSEEWWKYAGPFIKGLAIVRNESSLYNWIRADGKLLTDRWWSHIGIFYNNLSTVEFFDNEGLLKRNLVDRNGNTVSEDGWDFCTVFGKGFHRVCDKSLGVKLIGGDGKGLTNEWWDSIYPNGYGFMGVMTEGENKVKYRIHTDGKIEKLRIL